MRIPWVNIDLSFEKLAPKKSEALVVLEAQVVAVKEQNDLLESQLNLGPDPDQNLTGSQRHSLFRTIGSLGQGTRDFHPSKRDQILKMSHELYALRGDAYNLIELVVDHIIGERLEPAPVKVEKNEDGNEDEGASESIHGDSETTDISVTQEQIDEVWKDRRNRLHIIHEKIVTTGELEGEVFYMADYHPDSDGHIVLGYFPPENVRKVQKNAMGHDVFIEVDPSRAGDKPRRMYILNAMHDDIHIERKGFSSYVIHDRSIGANPSKIFVNGLCFAKFQNRPEGGTRGRPLLMTVLDHIDIHDELIWTATEREKLARMFILDITDNSIQTPQAGEEKLRAMGLASPPDAPKVLIHNERMKVEMMTPGNSGSIGDTSETVKAGIYGALGLPLEASGRDTNAAGGKGDVGQSIQGKRMRRKQTAWIDWFAEILCIMIKLRHRSENSEGAKPLELDPSDIKFKHMEVGGKDKSRGASMIKDLAISVDTMVNSGLIKRIAGNEILEAAFEDAGFTVSPENRGMGDSAMDQLKEMEEAGLTPKTNQPPPDKSMVGNAKGGIKKGTNSGDPQGRERRSVRRGNR